MAPYDNVKYVESGTVERDEKIKKVKFQIQGYEERKDVLMALATNGYKCWVEESEDRFDTDYFVWVELKKV